MKKLLILACAVLLAVPIFAGAPSNNSAYNAGGLSTTSITIDSQHTGTWKFIDSIAITVDDTAYVYLTVEATAAMISHKKLWLGTLVAAGSATNTTAASDTTIITWPIADDAGVVSLPINLTHLDSLATSTDSVFYFYLTGAVSGSSDIEKVALSGIKMSVMITNEAPF